MDIETRMEHIRQRLITARTNAGLSQSQVVTLLGLNSPTTLSQWETGRSNLQVSHLLRLAELYGCSEIWLLTGHNPYFDAQKFVDEIGPVSENMRGDLHRMLGLLETLYHHPVPDGEAS